MPPIETAQPLPGTKPFLGLNNLRQMAAKGLLEFVAENWQQYGDLFEVQLGPKRLVMVVHPDHVRHITLTGASHYDKLGSYDGVRKYIVGDGIVTATGEAWTRQRRLVAPFYTPRGVEAFAGIMLRDTLAVTERWQGLAARHARVDMFDEMALVTASIILKSIFSTEATDAILGLKQDVETMTSYVGSRLTNPLKLPDWVPTPDNKGYWGARKRTHEYIDSVITARLALDEADYPDDLLSKLITAKDPETGERMPRQRLRDEALTHFFAGYETSARTMGHVWYVLAREPEIRAKLHQELDRELTHEPTLATLKRLPYTLRLLKETLRLYPPAPVYAKDVVADDELAGYRIRKGSVVMLLPYFTHRHPDFWEEPLRFEPERHSPSAEKARHPQAFHPFGAGPRICLGNHFSLLETHILLAVLAKQFDPQLLPGYEPAFVAKGLLVMDNGLPMNLEKR